MNNPDEEQLRENEDENFKSKDAGASKKEVNDLMEAKARNDLLDSPDLKDLDDLLEAIEDDDQYYSEIFDTLM